jgi:hypothetical protein
MHGRGFKQGGCSASVIGCAQTRCGRDDNFRLLRPSLFLDAAEGNIRRISGPV